MGTAELAFTSIKVSYTSRARELERERERDIAGSIPRGRKP